MKKIVMWMLLFVTVLQTLCFAGYVNGYTRSDGTYVNGYYRSEPNSTVRDNYSYSGNTNPYTGEVGTNKYRRDPSSAYYSGL